MDRLPEYAGIQCPENGDLNDVKFRQTCRDKEESGQNVKTEEVPFKKDDIVTVTIEDIGNDGEGIGKADGYTLFIKDAVLGDTVSAKIMKATPSYAYAKLLEIITPSPFRTSPRCEIHKQCGGCQIQALDYDHQLAFKQRKVRNDLIRIGGFPEEEIDKVMQPIVGMEDPFRYRNKEQVPVGEKDGQPVTGFYAEHTHCIVPMTECCIGAEENQQILQTVIAYMKEQKVPAYDEQTGKGIIRHILIRSGVYSRQIMVCIVAAADQLPSEDALVRSLCILPGMTSISLNTNRSRSNVIMGKKIRTLWGEDTIEDCLHVMKVKEGCFEPTSQAVRFRISPLSFYQVNPKQTEKLYSLVLHYCGLTGKETVFDLYCGVGTISLFLAHGAKEVYGVESVPEAIEDARENARLNGITNVLFETGKTEEVLPAYCERHRAEGRKARADVIVVDPPRKGCDEICLQTMLDIQPERIVYVSCDPATLSRDLKKLCAGGYELKAVTPVDQFGHTVHVETVVLMSRVENQP
jgi:23S rRNA (uracil1939-C5)-methyltransferase